MRYDTDRAKWGIQIITICLAVLLGFLFAVFVSGCTTTQNIPVEHRKKVYTESKDSLFTAISSVLSDEGYIIETIDREVGLIVTKPKTGAFRRKVQANVNALSNNRSEVILTLQVEYYTQTGTSSSVPGDFGRSEYDRWFERIESRI